jgi:hypothetical protein
MRISLSHLLRFGIISFLLLTFCVIFSLFFTSKYSLSVISVAYNKDSFISLKTDDLLAKQKVSARFKAVADNLGIVSVRFKTQSRINNDEVIFKLKEENERDWYYEHSYRVDQFQDDDYFTFGLPVISNSENKIYYFEIESIGGKKGDAVSISETSPIFVVQYQFTKQQLLTNKMMIPDFLIKKMLYSFSDINFVIAAFIYALPFVFYIIWAFYFNKYLPSVQIRYLIAKYETYVAPNNYTLLFIYVFVFILSIFFKSKIILTEQVVLILFWVALIRVYRLHSSITFFLSLVSLSVCSISLIFNSEAIAENAAIWAYLFLLVGVIQGIYGLYERMQPSRAMRLYLRNLSGNVRLRKIKEIWDKLP